ncbi:MULTISPECIES: hypothetical protein [Vibrio]|uniref:hypothetical protein n=1 Tax=Vibrio TaxID=662 RepID=UPI0015604336|nr:MULTISPECIES: hypothetical protein [Vibrio]MCM5511019.1 hypothetical protein [Vibrio sp. SCSIO 43169]NRF33003.1 hypothetical protein [Vibrio coralliilyticus]NRF55491.1 hypothetical protein [Vibrio coralliilyticus]
MGTPLGPCASIIGTKTGKTQQFNALHEIAFPSVDEAHERREVFIAIAQQCRDRNPFSYLVEAIVVECDTDVTADKADFFHHGHLY